MIQHAKRLTGGMWRCADLPFRRNEQRQLMAGAGVGKFPREAIQYPKHDGDEQIRLGQLDEVLVGKFKTVAGEELCEASAMIRAWARAMKMAEGTPLLFRHVPDQETDPMG